ncbi:ABC transporter substrate-binding protein [Cupriavidus metallidurans]|jgi:polar amino acid transport system substrate-binding protein|uniref:Transporter substrate-binding domain-containing protein n=1 Tax=Cupriavidus metallidurans TaxID=119219 RepID=A0A482IPS0_9BURK|nr:MULTISPECIES: ABC transporter substrate-binding protein [Cupriavidus]HBD32132.1 amino acid ABC transporter substrate-binding protein [Cupriavidus sp.]KWR81194.1 amino acid ABC transporter substrate-binding protein [Cupriavidus sp. SHE]QBP08870.1 transporter substrate-binding domain-containing protein [Cupriavidus metallidurans]QWC89291.1 ABC transporter substrate-binding protein [Cupriavidus metallidurans]GMG89126.1 ABC transporter [Cupriavidus sp. TKC]
MQADFRRKLRQIAGVATLSALALSAAPASADQIADIKAKGQLVCGVLGTDEPFSFVDPATREIVGYDVDMCNAVAKSLGVKPVLKQISVAARLPELQQGHVDLLAASLTHNKERESQIDFSLSTFITGQKAMVRKESGITTLGQLDGKKILTVKGSTMESNIAAKIKNATVVSFDNSPQALLALEQGKGVAYVNDETSLVSNLVKLGPAAKDYTLVPQYLSSEHLALGIRKGETGFRNQVNQVLSKMEADGDAQKLYDKWFGPNTKMKFPPRAFKISTDKID